MSEQGNASADMWGKLGTSNGNDVGAKVRDLATTQMTPSQLEKAQDLAHECVRINTKGVELGNLQTPAVSTHTLKTL